MTKIKELFRILSVIFSEGFIFGCALYATIYRTWDIDLRIAAIWGIAFIIVFWLGDRSVWIMKEKMSMRKEEIDGIQQDIDREISKLRRIIPRLMMGSDGEKALANIYIDRIIELGNIKCRMEYGVIEYDYTDNMTKNKGKR